jgi:hypothetical protein
MIPREHRSVTTKWGTIEELMADYTPTQRWHYQFATQSQKDYLHKLEVPTSFCLMKGEASHLISKIREKLPPTARQQCFLRQVGLWHHTLTRTEASRVIDHVLGHPDEEHPEVRGWKKNE